MLTTNSISSIGETTQQVKTSKKCAKKLRDSISELANATIHKATMAARISKNYKPKKPKVTTNKLFYHCIESCNDFNRNIINEAANRGSGSAHGHNKDGTQSTQAQKWYFSCT